MIKYILFISIFVPLFAETCKDIEPDIDVLNTQMVTFSNYTDNMSPYDGHCVTAATLNDKFSPSPAIFISDYPSVYLSNCSSSGLSDDNTHYLVTCDVTTYTRNPCGANAYYDTTAEACRCKVGFAYDHLDDNGNPVCEPIPDDCPKTYSGRPLIAQDVTDSDCRLNTIDSVNIAYQLTGPDGSVVSQHYCCYGPVQDDNCTNGYIVDGVCYSITPHDDNDTNCPPNTVYVRDSNSCVPISSVLDHNSTSKWGDLGDLNGTGLGDLANLADSASNNSSVAVSGLSDILGGVPDLIKNNIGGLVLLDLPIAVTGSCDERFPVKMMGHTFYINVPLSLFSNFLKPFIIFGAILSSISLIFMGSI